MSIAVITGASSGIGSRFVRELAGQGDITEFWLIARRRERIAKGSGTTMADVNRLLKQFEDTRKMMKTVAGGNFQQQMQRMQRGGMRRR